MVKKRKMMIQLNELIKKLVEIEKNWPDRFFIKASVIEMDFSILDNKENMIIIKEKSNEDYKTTIIT
jgi:hypothetical protein